ncbi:cysteine synthase, putative [Bodo saltans]|uniref:cysteine synthase n=1 Tax=Bodo saltans TaxID=75058 RepID=A0A0S4JDZ7_BODSA|nr:cysteine synthase, putative [Bodo saltans]|eukprot:CUG89794.1 cysteine synthase, putative [Bodo saltans]
MSAPFDRNNDIASSFLDLIGQTPMLYLPPAAVPEAARKAKIALKLECENPMASVKDRLALGIILKNEQAQAGKFKPGETIIVESSSGNTGIALAHLGASRGYRVIVTMPETMSLERRCLLLLFGAEVILTPGSMGMKGAIKKAKSIVESTPNAVLADQFGTSYNAQIHYETTGPEVWAQSKGKVDAFVAGVGTGGTITGTGRYLREKNPDVKIIAVEPSESPVISGGNPGPHKIQGIGAGFLPDVLDKSLLTETIQVSSDDAIQTASSLPRTTGVFAGFSAGANVRAAIRLAERPEYEGKLIVAVIPSFGERYLTTALYQGIRDAAAALPVVSAAELQ